MKKPSALGVILSRAVLKWLFFAVLVSTSPLLARWWNAGWGITEGSLAYVLGRGELYLISAALTGEAVGEAINAKAQGTLMYFFKTISVGGCLIIVFLAASAYQHVADWLDAAAQYDAITVATQSLTLFIVALIVACSCISIGCNAK